MADCKLVKIIVIGDSGVGKTSLLNQYCYNKFDKKINPTIGCDFISKTYQISEKEELKMQLWDIAGQESFQAISKLFIRGALGCIIVTDITNPESINSALKWKELVEENCDYYDSKAIPIIMVQNKIDLLTEKQMTEGDEFELTIKSSAKQFAKENGFVTNIQVSAKENMNLEKIFKKLIKSIIERKLINNNDSASNFGEGGDGDNFRGSRSKSSLLELKKNYNIKKKTECFC